MTVVPVGYRGKEGLSEYIPDVMHILKAPADEFARGMRNRHLYGRGIS